MLKRIKARIRFNSMIREGWLDADGDADQAMAQFENRVAEYEIDPATLVWLIKLAYEIYKLWQSLNVKADEAATATIPVEIMRSVDWTRMEFLVD